MKRFKRVSCIEFKHSNYEKTKIIVGKSVVDKSQFRPNIDDVRILSGNGNTQPLYDFPDGKDNGIRLSILRSMSSDISEIEAEQNRLSEKVNLQKKQAKNIINQTIENELAKASEKIKETSSTVKAE